MRGHVRVTCAVLLLVLCCAVSAVGVPGAELPAGLILVLFPTVAAWCSMDRLRRRLLREGEWVLWSLLAALTNVAIGGFLLNVAGGLSRISWSLYLGCSAVILWVVGAKLWGSGADATAVRRDPGRMRLSWPSSRGIRGLALLFGALLLAAAAVAGSELSYQHEMNGEHFVALSITANRATAVPTATIEVQSLQVGRHQYVVRVSAGGNSRHLWKITLQDKQAWQASVPRVARATTTVEAFEGGKDAAQATLSWKADPLSG